MTDRPLTPQERATIDRYLETRRARPQARPLPSAGLAVNRVMRPLAKQGRTRAGSARALIPIWPEIMGPRWSKISTPVRFKAHGQGENQERTLIISAPGPAAALIMAASGQIIERLNTHLGAKQVTKIQVVQAAQPPSKGDNFQSPQRGLTPSEDHRLREGLTKVRNERLRDVLERLGREVIRRQP